MAAAPQEEGKRPGRNIMDDPPRGGTSVVTKVFFAVGAVAAGAAFALSRLATPDKGAGGDGGGGNARWGRYRAYDELRGSRPAARRPAAPSPGGGGASVPPMVPPSEVVAAARAEGRLAPLGELMGRVYPERERYVKRTGPRRGFCAELYEAGRLRLTVGPLAALPPRVAYAVFEYLQLHEACAARGVCREWNAFLRPLLSDHAHLSRCARQGFCDAVRGECWALAAGAPRADARKREMYRRMVAQPSASDAEIGRDGNRTLTHHGFFPSDRDAEDALVRMLSAYATHDPGCGYTQGMNFVAGFLLTVLSEEEAYWLLYSVMVSPRLNVRGLFAPGLPALQVAQYQLQRLVDYFLPRVAGHFRARGIDITLYSTEWYMTLFTYNRALPLRTAARIWDEFVVSGWKSMHRVALAVLDLSAPTLLELDFEQTVQYLKLLPDQGILAPDLLLGRARRFKVTNRLLHRLGEEYAAGLERLSSPSSSPPPPP